MGAKGNEDFEIVLIGAAGVGKTSISYKSSGIGIETSVPHFLPALNDPFHVGVAVQGYPISLSVLDAHSCIFNRFISHLPEDLSSSSPLPSPLSSPTSSIKFESGSPVSSLPPTSSASSSSYRAPSSPSSLPPQSSSLSLGAPRPTAYTSIIPSPHSSLFAPLSSSTTSPSSQPSESSSSSSSSSSRYAPFVLPPGAREKEKERKNTIPPLTTSSAPSSSISPSLPSPRGESAGLLPEKEREREKEKPSKKKEEKKRKEKKRGKEKEMEDEEGTETMEQLMMRADGFIFVFSLVDPLSLALLSSLLVMAGEKGMMKGKGHVIVGNKLDLVNSEREKKRAGEREGMSEEAGRKLATDFESGGYVETSAKSGEGLALAFQMVVMDIAKKRNLQVVDLLKPKRELAQGESSCVIE